MSPQVRFLAELIEIRRAFRTRIDEIGNFFGAGSSSIALFDEEMERLTDLILDLSGVTAKRNEYHDDLVAQGAPNIGWACLEELKFKIYTDDESPSDEFAQWLLDYADGKLFGTMDNIGEEFNESTVNQHGLLPPREERKRRSKE